MASQMDALSSFYFLSNNLPDWLGQLDDLSTYTRKRHSEFAEEYIRLLKYIRPKKTKSASLISHRSDEKSFEQKERASKTSISSQDRVEISPFEAGNKYLFVSAREKEKNTGASVRSGASGPRKFRSKHAVVIYFDSHVQTSLEVMVKSIATARNNLRKGKKARDISKGPTFPSFATFNSTVPDFKRSNFVTPAFNINPKTDNTTPTLDEASVEKCFELADKDLEQAQNLCETAAHQFLRDGDISVEMKNTKEKFERVLKLAKRTAERLKKEEQEQKGLEESDTAVDEGTDFKLDFQIPPLKKDFTPKDDHTTAIEVDSDDGGPDVLDSAFEKEFDISRYRSNIRPNQVPA